MNVLAEIRMSIQEDILNRIRDSIVNLDIEGVKHACKDALGAGLEPYRLVQSLGSGMEIVGQKYEKQEYFLADLMMAGEAMKEGMAILNPHFKIESMSPLARVVLGTVRGDLHDIGKNIVRMFLEAAGFEVSDLGVDVSADVFVDAVRDYKPHILGMSALLTTTMPEMRTVIEEIERARARNKVKIIIGGAPVSSEYGKDIGADGTGSDAVHGVNLCKTWMNR
jgi:methanogenic corrinoid protein MtbC1